MIEHRIVFDREEFHVGALDTALFHRPPIQIRTQAGPFRRWGRFTRQNPAVRAKADPGPDLRHVRS